MVNRRVLGAPFGRYAHTLVAMALLAAPSAALCQDSIPLWPGQRVRVVQSGSLYTVGTFASMNEDSISILAFTDRTIAVALTDALRIEVSRGMRMRGPGGALKGAALGFGYGTVGGLLGVLALNGMTAVLQDGAGQDPDWWPGWVYVRIPLALGITVGTVGGIIGGVRPVESWQPVRVRPSR